MLNSQKNDSTIMCSVAPESFNSEKIIHNFNFFNCLGPGLYEIYCKVNKKRYIGEASNLLDRLAKHSRNLLNNLSDCPELQKDWNQYGPEQFEAHILLVGPAWKKI
jgi:hypothetical protein